MQLNPWILGLALSIAALGCGSQSKEPPATNGTAGDTKTETPPPPEVVGTETPPPPAPGTNPGGPSAAELVQCSAESRRAELCTQQHDPVCADVDTGVRCVRAPCPESTERKTFSNACMACKEAKVMAYRKGSCEGSDKATF
jgi:hypothetical protein